MAMSPRRTAARLSQLQNWTDGTRSELERSAQEGAAHPGKAGGGDQGHARGWSFREWFASVDFPAALARCVEEHLCGPEEDPDKFMLVFLQRMGEHGSKEVLGELLQQCGAITALVDTLWQGGEELNTTGAVCTMELNEKFLQRSNNFEMSYGSISDFFGGLEKFIGTPDPKLRQAMEKEHCCMSDAHVEFTTGNYGIRTTPSKEWLFATGGDPPYGGWPQETKGGGHRREPQTREWLLEQMAKVNTVLKRTGEVELKEEEAIGLRLYTGPMFQLYNDLLRAIAHQKKRDMAKQELDKFLQGDDGTREDEERRKREALDRLDAGMKRFESALRHANTYTTTVHVINSALVKLGKIQKATKVYRGLCGGLLPKEFWVPNEWEVCGGVENGFLSTTGDRDVAMAYAASDPDRAGTVFEIQMSMVDRGADLSWVSQYPHEVEVCFPPLTGLQVLSTRVERSVLVVQARLDINMHSLTIEEVVAKRHKMVVQLCDDFCDEVHEQVLRAEGEWKVLADALVPIGEVDERALWQDCVKRLQESMSDCMQENIHRIDPQKLNGNEAFVSAVRRVVDIKSDFEKPTPASIIPFLSPLTRLHKGLQDITKLALHNVHRWPQLDKLTEMNAAGLKNVTDEAVRHVARSCRGLRDARFGGCHSITDQAVRELAEGCPSLLRASFSGCWHLTDDATHYLAEHCRDLQHVDFDGCHDLTDNAVLHLASSCKNLQHANFGCCYKLTDDAVRCLAERCKKLEHANFSRCGNLTDNAVKHLAENCRGLQHADFLGCEHLTEDAVGHLAENCKWLERASVGVMTWEFKRPDLVRGSKLTDASVRHIAENRRDLQYADFSCCDRLTDSAVSHLADNCQSLQHADFSRCSLTDHAVKCLAERCANLLHAIFGGCGELTDGAVRRLADNCKSLQHVDFAMCEKITDSAVSHLAENRKKLQRVNFSGCGNLTDDAVKHIAQNCKSLQHADFSLCSDLTDKAVEYLAGGCRNLKYVNFSSCEKLTDHAVKHLADTCFGLQHAEFGGCTSLTEHSLRDLASNCEDLRHGGFSGWDILTDYRVKQLAEKCTDLQHVDFSGCVNLKNTAVQHLADHCKNLLHVSFSGCVSLTDSAVTHLAERCKKLQHVDFSECEHITEDAVKHLAENCRKLQEAHFRGCSGLMDTAIKHLAQHCGNLRTAILGEVVLEFAAPDTVRGQDLTDEVVRYLTENRRRLHHVDFSSCERLTDEAFTHLAENCTDLKHVDVSQCSNLTDSAVRKLAESCRNLLHADFCGCGELTDDSLRHLAESCRGLECANFSLCENITDNGVKHLAESGKNLRRVDFDCCHQLTDKAVEYLADQCKKLRHASFRGCRGLTDGAVDAFRKALPACTISAAAHAA